MTPPEREPEPAVAAAPAGPPAEDRPARLDVLERHLRVVTDRVNELGRMARSQQADTDERDRRAEATGSGLRDELAALRASSEDTRAEVRRLAGVQAELELWRAERPPAPEAGAPADALVEEMARLVQVIEDQRAEVARLATALSETQRGHAELAVACQVLEGRLAEAIAEPGAGHVDKATVEELVITRLAETEARLSHLIGAQRMELEGAVEGSVSAFTTGFLRANDELVGGQAVLEERIEVIAGQVAQTSSRLEVLLDRLDAMEAAGIRGSPAALANPDSQPAAAGDLLDNLDRQLEAAARRLAARGHAGANRGQS